MFGQNCLMTQGMRKLPQEIDSTILKEEAFRILAEDGA